MPHTNSRPLPRRPAVLSTATLVLAAIPGLASAAPPGAAMPDGLELGVVAYRYLYREPGLMQLEGPKVGVRGGYSRTDEAGKSGRIEATVTYGKVDYDSNGTGSSDNHDDTTVEARVLFGLDFGVRSGRPLMPYTGIGYRYLYNDLRGQSTTGHFGYRRESNYLYLPIGLAFHPGRFLAKIEVDYLLRGHQISYLSDVSPLLPDIRNDQHKGVGAKASVMVEFGHLSFGPWFNYWRIGDSEIAGGGLEPKNRTTEGGLELRYRY
jgi:hypothetical protein